MIQFLPVVRLRPLGKNVEVKKFDEATEDLNSVEKLMAGLLFRFALDDKCPAIFIRELKRGDEPIKGMIVVNEFPIDVFSSISGRMFDLAKDNFGTNEIKIFKLDGCLLLIKEDFMKGVWDNYEFELSGINGISIPAK